MDNQSDLQPKREEAARLGQLRYFTGKPCKYGHISQRYTVSGACITCLRETTEAQKDKIKALIRAAQE